MTGGQLANPTSIFFPLLPDLSPVRMPETVQMLLPPRCPCSENWTRDTVSPKEVGCLSTTPVFPYKEAAAAGAALSTSCAALNGNKTRKRPKELVFPTTLLGHGITGSFLCCTSCTWREYRLVLFQPVLAGVPVVHSLKFS